MTDSPRQMTPEEIKTMKEKLISIITEIQKIKMQLNAIVIPISTYTFLDQVNVKLTEAEFWTGYLSHIEIAPVH